MYIFKRNFNCGTQKWLADMQINTIFSTKTEFKIDMMNILYLKVLHYSRQKHRMRYKKKKNSNIETG